jgi:tRNA-2-methylthio-N6-dimethylallyladenosine synthase
MTAGTFFIETHGCQMNIYDSGFVAEVLSGAGYSRAAGPEVADIVLINTCSVRERAERKALSRASELAAERRDGRELIIGIIGCTAQRLGEALLARRGKIDLVAGPDTYFRLPALIEAARAGREPVIDITRDPKGMYGCRPASHDRVTAFVTIMRGCNNFCSYCVVPYVRGPERSKLHLAVLDEVRHLVDLGVREVTLIGQNVNSYDDGVVDFAGLLELVSGVPGLARIRFTTSHPKDLTAKVIERVAALPAVCEHIHLPLQSGSDRILELMNRGYTSRTYRDLAALARSRIPGLALSTDIMVGFPSEEVRDHEATLAVMEEVGFESAFMFRYSVRRGTAGAELPDDVPEEEKIRRLKEVIALQNSLIDRKKQRMPGGTVEILVEHESEKEPGFLIGRTRKNWLAKLPQKGVRRGEMVTARIIGVSRWMIACEPVEKEIGA